MAPTFRATLAAAFWSGDRKIRIRLQQWSATVAIYAASAAVMAFLSRWGVLPLGAVGPWSAFVVVGLTAFFLLIRSGASQRFADPALTTSQIVFGIASVMWGYAMTGSTRSATLFPLMVILTFGAFSLSWPRMAALTGLALLALAGTMRTLHALQPGLDAVVDIANFAIAAVMLPASSMLAARLSALRARARSQREELSRALKTIRELATHDDLTGLANRRHAGELLESEALRAVRQDSGFALAVVDLDHFKRINDVFGHAAGDQVLRRFAQEASSSLRQCDTVARWGGEEFLLLMPGAGAATAHAAVERLRRRVEALAVETDEGTVRFTLSAGIARHEPGRPVAETMARADRALYRAKDEGRNRTREAPSAALTSALPGSRPAAEAEAAPV